MGLVIFTPATAMEVMTEFPLWASVIITGTVATAYTAVVSMQPHTVLFAHTHTSTAVCLGLPG